MVLTNLINANVVSLATANVSKLPYIMEGDFLYDSNSELTV